MDGLVALQAALDAGLVEMQRCGPYPELSMLVDYPEGDFRLTYAVIEQGRVQAITSFVRTESIAGLPCLSIGYAVAEPARGQGLATQTVAKAIDDLTIGLRRNTGGRPFYIEAIIGQSNLASNRIATRLLSESPKSGTDQISGEPIYQYQKLIE